MESQVKSFLTQKTYTSQLEKLEEEDRNAMSELYKISISGNDILVAPGKTIMTDSGVAYCYVYVIQQEKVICKLGVYEKKTDTMPLFFDLSTFPEDSLRLFEEYEIVPTRLLDFKMNETETMTSSNNVFDYLIRELFPKLQDKKKKLNETYSVLHKIYTKDDQDKDMRPILKLISLTRKMEPPVLFLESLKEKATDKTKFALTLLALQPFFNVKFQFKNETEPFENVQKYEEMARRWAFDAPTILKVNIDTYELIEDNGLSVIPEETSKMNSVDNPDPDEPEFKSEPYEPALELVEEPVSEPKVEPIGELEEYNPEPSDEPIETVTRPPPVRKGKTQTMKSKKESKVSKPSEVRGTSLDEVIERSLPELPVNDSRGTSLNDVERSLPDAPLNGPRGTSLNAHSISKPVKRTKAKSESAEDEQETSAKIKMKRISKPKTKPKSESTKNKIDV